MSAMTIVGLIAGYLGVVGFGLALLTVAKRSDEAAERQARAVATRRGPLRARPRRRRVPRGARPARSARVRTSPFRAPPDGVTDGALRAPPVRKKPPRDS